LFSDVLKNKGSITEIDLIVITGSQEDKIRSYYNSSRGIIKRAKMVSEKGE
jgi:hypothetical protein|tara:strand:+ start:3859 stop:4011 length:153 start_codon:yes stop_codon:yes gene_type:complete